MATLNNNITTSWNGKKGSDVQGFIKNQFQNNIESINRAIEDIKFEVDEDGQTVNYQTKKVGSSDWEDGSSFKVVPSSSITLKITELSGNRYVKPNENYTLTIKHTAQKSGIVEKNLTGVVANITLNGHVLTKTLNPITSTIVDTITDAEIPYNFFKEGLNNIKVRLSYESETEKAVEDTKTFGVYSFTLCLTSKIDLPDGYHTLFESDAQTFAMNFSYKDNKGINLLQNESQYKDLLDYGSLSLHIYDENNAQKINKSGDAIEKVEGLTLSSLTSDPSSPRKVFYVQAEFYFKDDGTRIYSIPQKYQVLCKKSGQTTHQLNRNYFAYYIDKYQSYGNNTFYSTNVINCKQFEHIYLKDLYVYCSANTEVNYSFNGEGDNRTLLANQNSLQQISWDRVIDKTGENILTISAGVDTFTLTIVASQTTTSSLSVPTENLELKLTASGKNNESATQTWENNGYKTEFLNFDWSSNGWKDGALVVNNGAVAKINCAPFKSIDAKTISIHYKTINSNTNEPIISCYQSGKDGFIIYPQKTELYKAGVKVSTTYLTENSEKEITLVWYGSEYQNIAQIFINGTAQAILKSSKSSTHSQPIQIEADTTSLYLYNINYYKKALNFYEIQALYISHINQDYNEYASKNKVFEDNIDFSGSNGTKVTISSLPAGSRYMLIKSHPDGPDRPWEIINKLPPTVDKMITINGVETPIPDETKGWRMLAGPVYLITKKENNEGDKFNFYADRVTLSAQGTSSMKYPVKNFRIYFNKKISNPADTNDLTKDGYDIEGFSGGSYGKTTKLIVGEQIKDIDTDVESIVGQSIKKYQLRDKSVPADVFCLKADYAESSGTHNTGLARMANHVMEKSSNIRTSEKVGLPPNYSNYAHTYDVTSTVDGVPVYLFFQSKDGDIVYHGKYNLNNEKANADVFGFVDINDENINQKYFDDPIVLNEANNLKDLLCPTNDDKDSYDRTHEKFNLKSSYINPTECWEFSTNTPDSISNLETFKSYDSENQIPVLAHIGAFTYPYTMEEGYPFSNKAGLSGLDPFTETIKDSNRLAWFKAEQAWEMRYPDNDDIEQEYLDGATPFLLKSVYKWVHKHNVYLYDNLAAKQNHAEIFASNLQHYFNINFLLKYYVMTKIFACVDQRIKNCMLAFYCDPTVKDDVPSTSAHAGKGNSGQSDGTRGCPTGHMRGYFIFYDNDTILGLNNEGKLVLNWNVDEDTPNAFQGIDVHGNSFSGLWGNLEYCYKCYKNNEGDSSSVKNLGKLIETTYNYVRQTITDGTINEYLQQQFPDAIDNVDEEVKYLYPSVLRGDSGEQDFMSTSIEQYQGNRKYHRAYFLENRLNWFDGRYCGGNIRTKYTLECKPRENQVNLEKNNIKLTSSLDKWGFYFVTSGDSSNISSQAYVEKAGETGTIQFGGSVSNASSLMGLYGCSKIDFSEMYGSNCTISTINYTNKLPNLKEFILGPSNTDKYIKFGTYSLSDLLNSEYLPSLEKLICQNVKNGGSELNNYQDTDDKFGGIDLSNSYKLEELEIKNTNVDVILPNSNKLTSLKLYKPSYIDLINKTNLETIQFADTSELFEVTMKYCNNTTYKYILNILKQNYNSLESGKVNIKFGNNGYDEVDDDIIKLLYDLAKLDESNKKLNISGSIYNPNRDDIVKNGDVCYLIIQDIYKDLIISKDNSTTPRIYCQNGYDLNEGGVIRVWSATPIRNWNYTISNQSNKSDIEVITEKEFYCEFKAKRDYANVQKDFSITVTGDGQQCEQPINVHYNKISSITLASNTDITSSVLDLTINLGASTKNYLLNPNDELNTSFKPELSSSAENSRVQLIYSETGESKIQYNAAANSDSIITLSVGEISCSKTIYYDKDIINKSVLSTNTEYRWLYKILQQNDYSKLPDTLKRSDLKQITWKIVSLDDEDVDTTQDLTYAQYLKPTTTFIMPDIYPIKDVSIPEGTTEFQWNSIYRYSGRNGTGNGLYTGYEKITFPESVSKASVWLNTEGSFINNLHFDISKTHIKRIEKRSSEGFVNEVFNLSLTTSSSNSNANNILFDYNLDLEVLGNYSEQINRSESEPASIFNRTGVNQTSSYRPLYNLGCVRHDVKIGHLSNYVMDSEAIDWQTQSQYVLGLYYTFYKGSGKPSDQIHLTKIKHIGDFAFGSDQKSEFQGGITLGNNVESIGFGAFNKYSGYLGTSGAGQLQLENVKTLGDQAFFHIHQDLEVTLKNIESIGDEVFRLESNENKHKIYINNTSDNLSALSSSFGTQYGIKNDVYVKNSALFTKLKNLCGNYANIEQS